MIKPFKKTNKDSGNPAHPQVITPTVLSTSLDEALNSAFGMYAMSDSDVDELIAKTGKSRDEVLRTCLSDDEVAGCIDDIESAIKAKAWRIYDDVANGDVAKGQSGVSPEVINKFYRYIRRHIETFASLAVTAKLNGYAVAEYVYAVDDDGFIYIDKVLDKDGELDKFIPKRDGTLIYRGGGVDVVLNTHVKVLALHHKAKPMRPMGEMSIIKIYPAVLIRQKGWAYVGQFIARYAQPYVVGKQGGFSLLTNFTNKLFEFINGGATGIGADDDISIHQLSGDGSAFERIEQLANARIQKFLLGRAKTSELSTGSRSAQETDDHTRKDRIGGYLELTTKAIQHAIDAMLAVNHAYGTPINAVQGLWFEYVNEKDVDIERAERDKLYVETGQVRLTKEYLIDMVGYEAHHFEMTKPVASPSLTAGTGLSIQLSDSPNRGNPAHLNHHDPSSDDDSHDEYKPLSATQTKISQSKVDKVLSVLKNLPKST